MTSTEEGAEFETLLKELVSNEYTAATMRAGFAKLAPTDRARVLVTLRDARASLAMAMEELHGVLTPEETTSACERQFDSGMNELTEKLWVESDRIKHLIERLTDE